MTALLEARDLAAGYPGRPVLRDITLSLRAHELVAIVGANGAGKTTLLRALGGLLRPNAGGVVLDGVPLASLRARDRARAIAFLPQTFATTLAFTARDIAALGRTPYLPLFGQLSRRDHEAVAAALMETGSRELADRLFAELSGGERQRVVLAMALAQEARVLLLDEPTVHLDPAHQRSTLEHLRTLARGRGLAVAAVLHDLNLAAALCARVVVLRAGRIVADGTPATVFTQALVDQVFGPGLRVLDGFIPPAVVPRP